MKGIEINGITLVLGYLPGRKSLCFYFWELSNSGETCYPVAYVSRHHAEIAMSKWKQFTKTKKKKRRENDHYQRRP